MRLDPMNPAPPVTSSIDAVEPIDVASALRRLTLLCRTPWLRATLDIQTLDSPKLRRYRKAPVLSLRNEYKFIL